MRNHVYRRLPMNAENEGLRREFKLIPVRVTLAQHTYVKEASRMSGVEVSGKVRELLFDWALHVHLGNEQG
jgi:hypothetical protein